MIVYWQKSLCKPFQRFGIAILSFFIVAFGQAAWIPWLAPFAATIGFALFWMLRCRFWSSAFWFFCVQLIQLSWMTAIEYQGVYILFIYFIICWLLSLQFGLLSQIVHRWPHAVVAALWTLTEWSRLYVLCGFSWNPVGMSLTAYTPSLQMATLLGILGLSFWCMLTNLAFLHGKWKTAVIFAIFPYLYGLCHLTYHRSQLPKAEYLKVALVQTALLPAEKLILPGREKEHILPYDQWSRIFHMLRDSIGKIDMIVLPEAAVPFPARASIYHGNHVQAAILAATGVSWLSQQSLCSNLDWMRALVEVSGADVIAGFEERESQNSFASAFYWPKQQSFPARYDKRILVPLGEYIPFQWLQTFTASYGIYSFFSPGLRAQVFQGKVPFSISVCYEETFSYLMRESRLLGAQLFVNVTNDNWYPSSKLAVQHYEHARVRAVENGIPLIRACNTGITAVIDSLGTTLQAILQENSAEALIGSVPLYQYRTFYTWCGDLGIVCISCFFIIIFLFRCLFKIN